ncbi:carbohydrate-binding, CenC-like protein [Tanacetum coccineum]
MKAVQSSSHVLIVPSLSSSSHVFASPVSDRGTSLGGQLHSRNSDHGIGIQSDNMIGSPHGFIINWIIISKNITKVTEVIDVENWRVDNSRVLMWIVSLIEWNSSVSSTKSSIQSTFCSGNGSTSSELEACLFDLESSKGIVFMVEKRLGKDDIIRPDGKCGAQSNLCGILRKLMRYFDLAFNSLTLGRSAAHIGVCKSQFEYLIVTMKTAGWCYSVLVFYFFFMSSEFVADAVPYDYRFNSECLENPDKPQYNGGIVVNPELKEGLTGWTSFGKAKLQVRGSQRENEFVVAYQRNRTYDSVSLEFFLDQQKLYTFSAWLQISDGEATVVATFKTPSGYNDAGSTIAKSGCCARIHRLIYGWIAFPYNPSPKKSGNLTSIKALRRKSKVKIQAVNSEGKPLANRTLTIAQKFARFPFGCAINKNILTNGAYKNWFLSRFKYTTFENEMKWYTNERIQNQEDYLAADALLWFAKSNGIRVRGHNVFWDNPKYQPSQVIAWDILDENLHFNFFESKLREKAPSSYYTTARSLDRNAALFMNDFNTIESPRDGALSPDSYLWKLKQIWNGGYKGPLSIGLEGHFNNVNIPYMRSAIDKVTSSRLSIWLTEVDVQPGPNQTFKKKLTDKYCPNGEIKKLEIELWNPKVRGNDVAAYTQRFQELALMCTKFLADETAKIDKYIGGLPDNIHGNVMSARPMTLDFAIELANDLMGQKLRTYAERHNDYKRKADDSSRNHHQQQHHKKQNLARAYTAGPGEKKANTNNNNNNNNKNQKAGVCYECGNIGHMRRDCPKLKNCGNGNGNGFGRKRC